MAGEKVDASAVIPASADAIFSILTDPTMHAAIDGTGWVVGVADGKPLRTVGQIFRMAMHHPEHPDGNYETVNRVEVLERPTAICWKPGYDVGDGSIGFGGWTWRYDATGRGRGQLRLASCDGRRKARRERERHVQRARLVVVCTVRA